MHLLRPPLRVGPSHLDFSSPARILAQAHSRPALQVAPAACCCGPECSWTPQQRKAEKTVPVLEGRRITSLSSSSTHLICLTGFWTEGSFG